MAEVPITPPDLRTKTGIAPAFFGPNALPVPDMLDGRTQDKLRIELAADGYFGYQKDQTADLFARIYVPLWTPRVNLTVWMPVMEWYRMTPERQRTCRLQDTTQIAGHEAGDVYVSTDIQILKARKYTPDIAFRAAFKTASGGSFDKARYFDNSGYWFDLAVGKSLYFGSNSASGPTSNSDSGPTSNSDSGPTSNSVSGPTSNSAAVQPLFELRLAATLGFLCWQTDNSRQNDALMYGVQLLLKHQFVSLQATWGGYMGWEKYGDRPMTIKARIAGHIKGFEPFVAYQYGIKDYPFHQIRIGLAYNINILPDKK